MSYLFPLIIVIAMAAYFFFMKNKMKTAVANIGPALRMFYERTGYRYADLAQAPIEEQVRAGESRMLAMTQNPKDPVEMHLVRDVQGVPLHFRQHYSREDLKDGSLRIYYGCTWSTPAHPRVMFEVIERSLVGVGNAIKGAMGGLTRDIEPTFKHKITVHDAELAKKVIVYAESSQTEPMVNAAVLSLRDKILACHEVHLGVLHNRVFFADPFQKNLTAGLGGGMGQVAHAFDYHRTFELSIPVHDRICDLVASTARAVA